MAAGHSLRSTFEHLIYQSEIFEDDSNDDCENKEDEEAAILLVCKDLFVCW